MKPLILKPDELREFFHNCGVKANVYVSTQIRKAWMLSGESIIIQGKVYRPKFLSVGGGVWNATLI